MPNLSAPVAMRKLELSGNDCVEILIFEPQEKLKHEFHCKFRIIGLNGDYFRNVVGEDGVQALMLALERIGIDLYTSEAAKAGKLTWNGEADLGFPVPSGLEDLLPKRST